MFDDRVAAVKGISTLRQEITHLRRIIFSLRRIVYEITNDIQKFSGEDLSKYFNYLEDHINKALEVLESRKTVEIYKDIDFVHNSERTNRIPAILII
jgi:Mg2+ and Co2+ transporter CorA